MSDIFNGVPEAQSLSDETAICNRIVRTRNDDDINTLVLHNLREAVPYALTCCRCALSEGEVLSLCYTALRKAAKRFTPGGLRFFAYAKQDVRGEISRYRKSLEVVRNAREHETEGRPPREICNVVHEDDSEELVEMQATDGPLEPDYVEPEFDRIHMNEQWETVAPLLRDLSDRERTVLLMHYESGFSLEQIAKLLVPRVTRQTIGNIHNTAMEKLTVRARTKRLLAK